MKYINSQTKEIIDSLNITEEAKDFIFRSIEDAFMEGYHQGFHNGYEDGHLDGYSSGYENGNCDGYYEGIDDAEMNQQ